MSQMKLFDIAPLPKPTKAAAPAEVAPRRDDLTLWEQWHHWKPQPGYLVIIHDHLAYDTTGDRHYIAGMEAEILAVDGNNITCQATIKWYHQKSAKFDSVARYIMGQQFVLPYQVCAPIFEERPNKGYTFPKPDGNEHSNFIQPDENYTYLPSVDCWIHREEGDVYNNFAGYIDANDGQYTDGIELTEWFAALSEEELEIVKPHIIYFMPEFRQDLAGRVFDAMMILYDLKPNATGCEIAMHYAFYGEPYIKSYQYDNQEEAERDIISATRATRHIFEPLKSRRKK